MASILTSEEFLRWMRDTAMHAALRDGKTEAEAAAIARGAVEDALRFVTPQS